MSKDQIAKEVREFMIGKLATQEIIGVEMMAAEIINARSDIHGEDCDFYIGCAYGYLAGLIKKAISKYEISDVNDDQLVLDGFEYLQTHYPFERDKKRVLVPTDLCTEDEIMARADEYDASARGQMRHAEELRAYVKSRKLAAE
jgi:hypothetical protein